MSDVTDLKAEVLLLRKENAELRELVHKVEHYERMGCFECRHADGCEAGTLYDEECAMSREIEQCKQKLGIEVPS